MARDDGSGRFWFNIVTKQVEEGHRSTWQDLMGPYPTRAAAERALETAAARNEEWEAREAREKE